MVLISSNKDKDDDGLESDPMVASTYQLKKYFKTYFPFLWMFLQI
jgi:hypothetical protein